MKDIRPSDGPPFLSAPRNDHTSPIPHTTPVLYQWPRQLFRLQRGESGCDTRGSKPQNLLPLLGHLLPSRGCTPSSDSPCSSPLSPLHASRLACVHLCGEKMKDSSTYHLIFVTLPFPPLLCFLHSQASSPKPAAHHRASSYWLEPQERQLTLQGQTIGKREQVLPNSCQNYRRNFNSCLRSTMLFSPFKP